MKVLVTILIIVMLSACVDTQPAGTSSDEGIPEYSPVVDIAEMDLSLKLNIPVGDIVLVRQEAVDWPDTSLGYPEEGMAYAQVITPGFRIVLKAGSELYEYHSDYKRVVGPAGI